MTNSQLKSLTWKYFWEQKAEELAPTLGFLLIGWYVIGFVLILSSTLNPIFGEETFLPVWYIIIYLLSAIIPLVKLFIKWIKSNWVKASERAVKEMRLKEAEKK